MKLIKHFDAFLVNKVNLGDGRIKQLDERVNAITNFVQTGEDAFAANFIDILPQGSYAHRTIINPVRANDEFDADLLLEMNEIEDWEAEDYVQELYTVFRNSSTYRDMVSRHDRCIRIDYANEFHIDLVPYMERHDAHYITNRAENQFELSNPEGYNEWLVGQNKLASGRLVKVIRLMKYLRDFKDTFSCKSVILSILLGNSVSEAAAWGDDSLYTDVPTALKNIVGALDDYLQNNELMPSIDDPSEPTENYNHRWDQDEYANFRTKIHVYRGWIDEAYDEEDADESKVKWRRLFGEKFGTYDTTVKKASEAHLGIPGVRNTDETLESRWGIRTRLDGRYRARIIGRVAKRRGFREYELGKYGNVVPRNSSINFRVQHDVPAPSDVYWKVRNTGEEAIGADCIRGQVEKDTGNLSRVEPTSYKGRHYVEAYVVKDGVCVAMDHQEVRIK
ncbi:cyclic GMP-AMP synthase DncV-like nucleotidyltransferase [Microbacterium sp. cx-59]|uniref:SMODS domain-containing nucleotidyltransferase n=1 Tax=Microbacterium sp. cx-59 TaxID=2891207 RepID=UPI001E2FF0F6|nr:nucleotidyltransferase [Microbacterium sp. cx-59]MCC4907751.1 nucleotidyltransferase [Microbacterium sp. cx-59]